MPILTANINFLASLGITTSEQFMAAFGDMAAFTEYCDEIGYSWEIDENNDLILITPNGNTVNTYIEVEAKTATPTITVTPGNTAYTIEATGNGTVKLYIDGTEVPNPVVIERTNESQEITVTATAQEEGKEISDEAEEEIVIPALDTTAAPDIDYIEGLDSYDIIATGDGTVKLYLGGNEVANPYTVVRTDQNQTLTFTATAQESGKQISDTTEEEFVIPALPVSDTPVITATKRDADYLISVSAGQDAVINITCDGEAMANPFVITRGNSNTTVTIIATATEPHHSMATTSQQVLIEALPITATPTISYTQGLTAYTITATGNGTVLLYADGNSVSNPCSISRTTTAQTIVFTATAQEANHQISATATETVTIPAMEVTPTPVITYDSTTFTVDVTGNGTVLSYVDGVATQMPHTFTQGASAVTYVVTATAQEVGKQISATATQNCVVPAAVIKDYLKMSVLNESGNNGNITITIPAQITSTQATSLSYSKDGINWTDTTIDNTAQTITIPVNAGDEVYLKGVANRWSNDSNSTKINSTANINASGNIMSLLYGDNFENQTSFPVNSTHNFGELFMSNTHLVSITNLELPATTLVNWCYYNMFYGCSSLITAPALPATTLATSCYQSMFRGCNSLTSAPSLPATTLAPGCYASMFNGCSSLNSITMLAEDISASKCLNHWVQNVAATGTFTKAASMTSLPTGESGIPTGWTVVDYGVVPNYMSLTSAGSGDITITIPANVDSTKATSLSYSKDGTNWTDTAIDNTDQTITIPVNNGDVVYLKGIATRWAHNFNTSAKIDSTVNISTGGNIMSLLYGDNFENQTTLPSGSSLNFVSLFKDNTHLTGAGQLTLPATTLTTGCYGNLFRGCTSLTTAPASLPASTLIDSCYASMFQGCTSLTTTPTISATRMATQSCAGMFQGCTSLTTAPSLPATSLAEGCYYGMFKNCSSLTTATALPVTSLANNCYEEMFAYCTSLTSAPALPASTLNQQCYYNMFAGCTSLTTAPDLAAVTLARQCYGGMFNGCNSLNSITMLAEDISAYQCLYNWVDQVSATGTFTKSANMTTLSTGQNGIPSGWTVVDYTP